MTFEELKDKALSLPYEPGVYLMQDKTGTVIYVGKAKKLKNRVSQYFQDTASHTPKTRKMVSQIDHFDTIVARSEFEALVLECSLIKRHMPKYNILLKDDKGYPYLRVDLAEDYPTLQMVSRITGDKASYFGPFGGRSVTQHVIDTLRLTLKLPGCSKQFPRDLGKERPCLNYHMNNCDGWCQLSRSQKDYHARMEQAVLILQGNYKQVAGELRAQAEKSLSGQSELLRSTSRLGDEIAEKKSVLAGYAAERETTEKSLASLEGLRAQMQGDEQSRKALIEQYRAASEQSQREIGTHETEIAALSGKMTEKRAELEALSKAKLALEAERSQSDRRGRELNENVLNVERSVSKLEQKRATSAMEEQQILDKLWENYELSHSAAQEQRIELESVAKASRRIGELKRAISGLGAVNVGAIEEFERVNTRYTYLTTQRDDVEKAKGELVGVIDSITSEMTVIFKEQFALIRESFQETFLELFGGGKATLELEDENDVLSCGIEIKVQPPGKALKTITLLSGGEKAFVAIALYFAILKVHPTPFCVMDEIEAALDEPNVVRVANYMRRITQKTQFIVITHRRGTMEAADVLYGVTMQERGVSKVLTINMNDMAKELNIKE